MRRYWEYLKYVLIHKYHVGIGCRKVGLSWFRALIHDYDKFHPGMFIAYARFFYNPDGSRQVYGEQTAKERADMLKWWRWHYGRNKHHWDYWVEDAIDYDLMTGNPREMDYDSMREMVADWYGAGIAIHGKEDVYGWYTSQMEQGKINLHPETKFLVEDFIQLYFPNGTVEQQGYKPNV